MRKFIDIQGIESGEIENVFSKHPELNAYIDIFFEIEKLEPKIYDGVSPQVEDEYLQLVDSIDEFLFRPEILQKFTDEGYEVVSFSAETQLTEEEAKERLEREIEEMTKGIDESLLAEQTKKEETKRIQSADRVERLKRLTREDMGDDEYWGKQVLINDFDGDKFDKCLSMLRAGFKFYTASFAEKNYTMFKLSKEDRVIIQTKLEPSQYDQVFVGTENRNFYILSKNKKNVSVLYNTLRYAIGLVDEDNEPPFDIKDEHLFNHPILNSAFEEDVVFVPADELAQGHNLLTTDIIPSYFNTHLGLDKILTLTYCEVAHRTLSVEERSAVSEKIEKNIKEKKLNLEGFGVVPHSPTILQTLIKEHLIDNNYALTKKGLDVRLVSSGSRALHPEFQPFQYYKSNLKKIFKNSKEKYYSNYNGTNVYYITKSQSQIKVAMALPGNLFKQWGFEKAVAGEAFNPKWQANQEFEKFREYVPFSSEMRLTTEARVGETKLRGLEDKLNFANRTRYLMYVACKEFPMYVYAINSSNYNFIKDMYKNRDIRITGSPISSLMDISGGGVADFLMSVVDESDNLLALLPLEGVFKAQSGQLEIDDELLGVRKVEQHRGSEAEYTPITSKRQIKDLYRIVDTPAPVWEFEQLVKNLTSKYPKFIDTPPYISDAADLQWQTEEEEKPSETTRTKGTIDIPSEKDAKALKKIASNPNLEELQNIDYELNAYNDIISDLEDFEKTEIEEEINKLNKRKEALLNTSEE